MKKKRVSKFFYCVIIILFGSVGIHKLYAGHTFLGVLYMCLCWTGISEILTIIDFFNAIMEKSDDEGKIYV